MEPSSSSSATQRPPVAMLSRRETFSASHRLHSPELSDEANVELYGKCNNPNGHGHNYCVEIMVKGEVDPATGMVINLTELKEAIHRAIIEPLDHKNLDKDVEWFKDRVSTTENVAIFCWQRLSNTLESPAMLHEVRIHETEKNAVIYRGE